jgi:lipopolysaccharide export system permease protein
MYALSLYFVPVSQQKLRALMFEVRQSLTGQLVKDGRFFHPMDGVSIYIRESNKIGEMKGIFLTDARNTAHNLTYSAREAVLHETLNGLLLVLQDGLLQISNNQRLQLSTVSFDRLALSLDEFFPKKTQNYLSPKEVFPLQIIYDFDSIDRANYKNRSEYIAEAHLKLATPLNPIALTLLALTTFLITGYKRKGFTLPIYVAITVGLAVQAMTLSMRSVITANNSFFWTVYSPSLLLILCSLLLLYLTQRSRKEV